MKEKPRVVRLLLDEHKTIRGLLSQFEADQSRTPEMLNAVAREIFMRLEIHALLEEEFFYPALLSVLDGNGRAIVDGCLKDHEAADLVILEGRKAERSGHQRTLRDKMAELTDVVRDHIDLEEIELLPRAEWALLARSDELTDRMEERRALLEKDSRYRDSVPERVQDPHGGEQKRKHAA